MLDKESKIHGLRLRAKELSKLHDKHTRLKARYDAFYTAVDLMADCLEYPDKTTIEATDHFIKSIKDDLEENDLVELRKIREFILSDINVAIETVFPGSKKINIEE